MSDYPRISPVGLSGFAVTFASAMTDRANLAAIAFRASVDAQDWPEVTETASTLVSCFIGADLAQIDIDRFEIKISTLLHSRDWLDAAPPPGRKLWTLPMCFDGASAPQLAQAANFTGMSEQDARMALGNMRTRVITLGYAPGQPYLGTLPEDWDIPRQTKLNPTVPAGALVVAIRQFVLFTASMPTGWLHVGQTAFRPFDPDRDIPIALTPGDEIQFAPITEKELSELSEEDSMGGAAWEPLS